MKEKANKNGITGSMSTQTLSILFVGIMLPLFFACNNKIEDHEKRNILFYMGGDNDLIGETHEKINQLRAGWQPGNGEMIIYADQANRGACLLRINETKDADGLYGLDTLDVYERENSADARVLERVVNTFFNDYEADRYGMIFFSHASGWLPKGMLTGPRSMVIDNGGGSREEMEYDDFAAALPDHRFDFIILEACLMSDVLFMYEMRNKADYILASCAEIVSPGFGGENGLVTNTYRDEIMRLYDTQSSIRSIVSGFGQAYFDHISTIPETNEFCSATLSLIKMDEMTRLAAETRTALQGVDMTEENLKIDEVQSFDRPYTTTFGWQQRSRYFDLGHAMEQLASPSQYNAFEAQLAKTVVWKASTKRFLLGNYSDGTPNQERYKGFFIQYHCGLTSYIKQEAYPQLNTFFEHSSWYNALSE